MPVESKLFEKLQEEPTKNLNCTVEVRENWWRHLPQASCICCNSTPIDECESQIR